MARTISASYEVVPVVLHPSHMSAWLIRCANHDTGPLVDTLAYGSPFLNIGPVSSFVSVGSCKQTAGLPQDIVVYSTAYATIVLTLYR